MSKEEFLRELEEALAGDVPEAVIRDNVSYYGSYLSQEMAKGRSVEEVVDEIGEPFIIAKTIIEHSEAVVEAGGSFEGSDSDYGSGRGTGGYGNGGNYGNSGSYGNGGSYGTGGGYRGNSGDGRNRGDNHTPGMHFIDLNKWYWKLLAMVLLFLVVSTVFRVIGGIFVLLMRFSGPLLLIFLVYWFIKQIGRR